MQIVPAMEKEGGKRKRRRKERGGYENIKKLGEGTHEEGTGKDGEMKNGKGSGRKRGMTEHGDERVREED